MPLTPEEREKLVQHMHRIERSYKDAILMDPHTALEWQAKVDREMRSAISDVLVEFAGRRRG